MPNEVKLAEMETKEKTKVPEKEKTKVEPFTIITKTGERKSYCCLGLLDAIKNNKQDEALLIIERLHNDIYQSPLYKEEWDGNAFLNALKYNQLNVAIRLIQYGDDVCSVNKGKQNALMFASQHRMLGIMRYVSDKLDVNARDIRGMTALFYAVSGRDPWVIEDESCAKRHKSEKEETESRRQKYETEQLKRIKNIKDLLSEEN
jgi:hypothetical protein